MTQPEVRTGPETPEAKLSLCTTIRERLAEAIQAGDEGAAWRCVGWLDDLARALAADLPMADPAKG